MILCLLLLYYLLRYCKSNASLSIQSGARSIEVFNNKCLCLLNRGNWENWEKKGALNRYFTVYLIDSWQQIFFILLLSKERYKLTIFRSSFLSCLFYCLPNAMYTAKRNVKNAISNLLSFVLCCCYGNPQFPTIMLCRRHLNAILNSFLLCDRLR